MTDPKQVTRRTLLTVGGVGAVGGVAVLAACAPSDAAGSGNGSGSGDAGAGAGSSSPSSAPSAEAGTEVAALADIPVGGSIDTTIDGAPALVAQPEAGTVVAFSAICTHQGCVVAAAGDRFECPCHASVFDAATGEPTTGPALEPLAPIAVTVSGDRVVTA